MDSTDIVKVAVRTTREVYRTATRSDDEGYPIPVTCTTAGTNDPACSGYQSPNYPTGLCQNLVCVYVSNVFANFYVKNFNKGDQSQVFLPCDGKSYTIEVYGATSGTPNAVTEMWRSVPIPTPLPGAACSIATAPDYTAIAPPEISFPTIYAQVPNQLMPGQEEFTVNVTQLIYPWSRSAWSLTHGTAPVVNPTRYAGSSATFASPTTTDALVFKPVFHLESSLLLADEATNPNSWELTLVPVPPATFTRTPVSSGGVGLP